ncbi:MAG: hypothetical protein AB7S75_22060 [Desulfococcaceae bacterium]
MDKIFPDNWNEIEVPADILWDYRQAPKDILWRLQRIADFFPTYGTDRKTVRFLFAYRDLLKIEKGRYRLIELYEEVWRNKTGERN